MKKTLLILAIFISHVSFAQDDASKLLAQYGFTIRTVLGVLDNSQSNYSFKATSSNHAYSAANNTNNTTNRVYSFDNTKPSGQKFSLVSVNGKNPTKKQVKHFNKEKNAVNANSDFNLTEKDFFVKSKDKKTVVIGFNLPKEDLPVKVAFMAHCTGYIYIDEKTGLITEVEIKSNEAFNLKIFHITEMKVNIDLAYNKDKKKYYITKETTNTKTLVLGTIMNIDMEEVYSDFKFN